MRPPRKIKKHTHTEKDESLAKMAAPEMEANVEGCEEDMEETQATCRSFTRRFQRNKVVSN